GGNALNVAIQLRRLGRKVAYFGAVGDDAEGRRTAAALGRNGVATGHLRIAEGPTAYTDIGVDAAGERTMLFAEFGVCRGYRPRADEVVRLRGLRLVHIGWLADGGALKRDLAAAGVAVSQDLTVNAETKAAVSAAGLAIAFTSAGAERERAEALLKEALQA